jgi:O-acetyl-ADP-ribose deacetylase
LLKIGYKSIAMLERIAIIQGDITTQKVDAIVNAANSSLLGGGGVDGAIHRAAGPGLDEECRRLKGCEKGEAKITKGYNLPARWVIHTVGPVWHGGRKGEDEMLARCYQSCFNLADQHKIRTLAFPSISTGAYRFPVERASKIALREIKSALAKYPNIEKVSVVCFDKKTYDCYLTVSDEILEE